MFMLIIRGTSVSFFLAFAYLRVCAYYYVMLH